MFLFLIIRKIEQLLNFVIMNDFDFIPMRHHQRVDLPGKDSRAIRIIFIVLTQLSNLPIRFLFSIILINTLILAFIIIVFRIADLSFVLQLLFAHFLGS
jgi:hypothetical protein